MANLSDPHAAPHAAPKRCGMSELVEQQIDLERERANQSIDKNGFEDPLFLMDEQLSYTDVGGRVSNYSEIAKELESHTNRTRKISSAIERKSIIVDRQRATEVVVNTYEFERTILFLFHSRWKCYRISEIKWQNKSAGWRIVNVVILKERMIPEPKDSVKATKSSKTLSKEASFEEQDGDSFNRANRMRPLHRSIRLLYALLITFCILAVATISVLMFRVYSIPEYIPGLIIGAIIGIAVLGLGLIFLFALVVHLITAVMIAKSDWPALRSQMRREQKSFRYVAKRKSIRDISIGVLVTGIYLIALCCRMYLELTST